MSDGSRKTNLEDGLFRAGQKGVILFTSVKKQYLLLCLLLCSDFVLKEVDISGRAMRRYQVRKLMLLSVDASEAVVVKAQVKFPKIPI